MLHIYDSAAGPASDAVLRAMFAARKAVFVDLLKWDVPVLAGAYEVDQFDDSHAIYLILADRDGRHLGSTRLLPTTRPHILDSFYGALCESSPPKGSTIYEITRFCLDRRLTARERRQVRDTLVASLARFARENGITAYTAIAEIGWFQQILALGWRCSPLGLPRKMEGKTLAALFIEIDRQTEAQLEKSGITATPAILGYEPLAAA